VAALVHATAAHGYLVDSVQLTSADQLAGMIQGAFGQAPQTLRRYVEDHAPWDQV
jgi:hypothetical protein